jgi:dihydroorotase
VFPIGALTKGLDGEQLAELVALRDAGCVAFGNGLEEIPTTAPWPAPWNTRPPST